MTGSSGLDDWCFSFSAPGAPGVVIGTYVSGVAEIEFCPLALSQGLDFWIFFFKPLPHQGFVAFERAM